MNAQGASLEVGEESKEPVYELSGGHVLATSSESHIYQENPAYNVVAQQAGRGATETPPPEYEEIPGPADGPGSNPVQMVMSTPNVSLFKNMQSIIHH